MTDYYTHHSRHVSLKSSLAFHNPIMFAHHPAIAPLAQSSSRREFFQRLGLDERNPAHMDLYRMMKDEASAGRQRLSEDRANLTAQSSSDPRIRPPYTWDNLQETARHRTILDIYNNARAQTRQIYALGHYRPGPTEENWIIKWMLWHVFRYRDNRNRDSRNRHRLGSSSDNEGSRDTPSSMDDSRGPSQDPQNDRPSGSGFYDPIRDS